jgi:putative Mn2+ efflux pump MntP
MSKWENGAKATILTVFTIHLTLEAMMQGRMVTKGNGKYLETLENIVVINQQKWCLFEELKTEQGGTNTLDKDTL